MARTSKAATTKAPEDSTTGVIRGDKRIITIGFFPDIIDAIDKAAKASGISRAAWINMACTSKLEKK